jgi:hypothetical protein
MTPDEARAEWATKRRRMGCVSATEWFCHRVPGFRELRLRRDVGAIHWEHSVATNGDEVVDLVPHLDVPCCWNPQCECV